MSSSLSNLIPMLASVTLFSILIDPTIADKHDLLKKCCSKTNDKDMCVNLMKTGLGDYEDAGYKEVTGIALVLAYKKATDMYRKLKYHVDGRNRRNSIGVYDTCYRGFAYAAEDLEQAKNYFRNGDFKKIDEQIKIVVQQIQHCKNEMKKIENDEPYNLVKTTKEFEIFCDVVKFSAKYLKGDN